MIDVRSLEDSSKTTFGHSSLERTLISDLLDLNGEDKLDRDVTMDYCGYGWRIGA